jgi:triosephosphate isomerase
MAVTRRRLIAGNWKMNGLTKPGLVELKRIIASAKKLPKLTPEVLVCPPATLLAPFRAAIKAVKAERRIALGAQDCHAGVSGAHTGDLSAEMLRDAGAAFVVVGHSERRADHGEDNAAVRAKAAAAHRAGLTAIVCIGETLMQRDAGEALAVVGLQLGGSLPEGVTASNTVIAYEPVWAIGTGRTPTPDDVARVHAHIRERLSGLTADAGKFRILYGGSVKPGNAAELLAIANVDGALVGGASLSAADFWPIVLAAA